MFALTEKLKKKNADAVALLYTRYGKKLYGYSVSKWKISEDDAWDLVYKTLYRVISVSDKYKFEDESKFMGFLFKIFINYLRNHYRDSKNKHIVTVELEERHETKQERGEQSEKMEPASKAMSCLRKMLELLKDWQRILLLMRAQDYSYEEIGKYVDKPSEQLKVYHMRLKKQVTEGTNECVNKNEQ